MPDHLILGAGGHAKVLIDALQFLDVSIKGVLDPDKNCWGTSLLGVPILGGDELILDFKSDEILLVNALGSIRDTRPRRNLYETWKIRGYQFASVIHPRAIISPHAVFAAGVQILAGAVLNAGVHLGENVIINTAAVIEHDCQIQAHAHIAPGAVLAGSVNVGEGSHVGLGAQILQNLTVGEACLIAAGAVVVDSVKAGQSVLGIPARVRDA